MYSQPIQLLLNHYPPQSSISNYNYNYNENFTSFTSSNLTYNIRKKNLNLVNSSCNYFIIFLIILIVEMFDFNFKSAIPLSSYFINKNINGEFIQHKLFSSCIDQKNADIVDYIFYHNPSIITSDYKFIQKSNCNYIEPCAFYDIPSSTIENFLKFSLPNKYHPSDHVPLIVDFCLYF